MFKKLFIFGIIVVIIAKETVWGQANFLNIEKIKGSNAYFWGEEYGAKHRSDIKAKAIQNICISIPQSIYQVEELSKKVVQSSSASKQKIQIDQTYQDNTTKISFCDLFEAETIYDEKNKLWFAYISKESIYKKYQQLTQRFYELFSVGFNNADYSEKLRNYFWASQILQQIPGGNALLVNVHGDSVLAGNYVTEEILNILNHITCQQIILEQDKILRNLNAKNIEYRFECFGQPFNHFDLEYRIGAKVAPQRKTVQNGKLEILIDPDELDPHNKKIVFSIDYSYSYYIEPTDYELNKIITHHKKYFTQNSMNSAAQKSFEIPIGDLTLYNIPIENKIKINGLKQNIRQNKFTENFVAGNYSFSIERKKFETKTVEFTIVNDEVTTFDLSENKYVLQKYLGGPGNGFLSMMMPGVGTYYVTKKNSSFITTTAFILSILGAIYTQNQSNLIRDKYLTAQDPGNIANLYRSAQEQHTLSLVFSGIATTIYIVDVIHTFSRGTRNKRNKIVVYE